MTILTTRTFDSRAELDAALEERLAAALARTGAAPAAVMLAGGSTPLPTYRALAARPTLPHAPGLHILFSDERYVPSDSPASNYHRAQPLLAALALPAAAVLRVRTELPLAQAAENYEQRLSAMLAAGVHIAPGILGLGADGHTASLFTASDIDRARGRLAIAVQRPDGLAAVSVTPEFLAQVAEPLFVAAGPDKVSAVRSLLAADAALVAWRAVGGNARVELWTDREAAGET